MTVESESSTQHGARSAGGSEAAESSAIARQFPAVPGGPRRTRSGAGETLTGRRLARRRIHWQSHHPWPRRGRRPNRDCGLAGSGWRPSRDGDRAPNSVARARPPRQTAIMISPGTSTVTPAGSDWHVTDGASRTSLSTSIPSHDSDESARMPRMTRRRPGPGPGSMMTHDDA